MTNWHTFPMRRWCVMGSRAGERLWLLCLGNGIVITAPSLIVLVARAVRRAWRWLAARGRLLDCRGALTQSQRNPNV